jgi:hypothetical protein
MDLIAHPTETLLLAGVIVLSFVVTWCCVFQGGETVGRSHRRRSDAA